MTSKLLLFTTLSCLYACASAQNVFEKLRSNLPKDVTVDLSEPKFASKEITIARGTDLNVILQENRSTGYRWFIKSNTCKDKLQLESDLYLSHPADEGDRQWQQRYGWAGKRQVRF